MLLYLIGFSPQKGNRAAVCYEGHQQETHIGSRQGRSDYMRKEDINRTGGRSSVYRIVTLCVYFSKICKALISLF